MGSYTETVPKKYPKRDGTSGIRGQWYETKLLSLIYFRAIHNDDIEEIYVATNVDKVGSFDDICLRVKLKENKKNITVFIQAKHKEKKNSVLTLNKSDWAEYFKSSSIIRRKFKSNNEDFLFNGILDETECLFVIYTTAKGDKKTKRYEGSLAEHLNALIKTGDPGSYYHITPSHDEEHVNLLYEIVLEEHMTELARQMVKCIYGEFNDNQPLMKNDVVMRYHVILAQKVFNVTKIQPEGHRDASFRKDFFDINEEYLRLFKDELCTQILNRRNCDNPTQTCNLLNSLILLRTITDPETLFREVGSHFIYKNGKFIFLDKKTPDYYKVFLDKINESQENIRTTVEMAVKECLNKLSQSQSIAGYKPESLTECSTFKFKVPASFGNKDLTIKGDNEKVKKKLNNLALEIISFIEKSKTSTVTINQSSFILESAVGNLFVVDESDEKLLKFNDNPESLEKLAKELYCKLKAKIDKLDEYKFDVNVKSFPKLSLATDESTKKVVHDFLSTLIFYTSQCNEEEIESNLIYNINNSQGEDVKHVEVTSNAIFLQYHDAIQKWSMTPTMGTYLEKDGSLYKNAVALSTNQPLIGIINMMQGIKNKNYTFSDEAVNSIKLKELVSGTIIFTENRALTVAKLRKQFNSRDTVVLDFEYIVNLSPKDNKTLCTELMKSREVKTLIVIFDYDVIGTISTSKLDDVVCSMKNKRVIIITDQKSFDNAKTFSPTGNVIKDEKNSLIDMSEESRNRILEDTKVIFQGDEVHLGQILFKDSIKYVTGNVLNKMMHSNQNVVGKPVVNSNFKPKLYIERSVRQYFKEQFNAGKRERRRDECLPREEGPRRGYEKGDCRYLRTLHESLDKRNKNFLIIGDPGMGKSTLLTHLTLNTKATWSKMGWIVRINLLEHTTQFSKWKAEKTTIDSIKCFKFLCQAALSEESSKTLDIIHLPLTDCYGFVHVQDFTGNDWALFEMKMYLNFYNSKETLLILFDGFDEICPTYANEVLALIKAVQKFSRNHKMWITSRSYNRMNTILELQFDTLFEIEPLESRQQNFYLTSFWDEKKILKDLNEDQFRNIDEFIRFMWQNRNHILMLLKKSDIFSMRCVPGFLPTQLRKDIPLIIVCLSFIKYLKINLTPAPSPMLEDLDKLFEFCNETRIFENEFVTIPLHLNMLADYFHNKIKDVNLKPNKWNWVTEHYDLYKYFLETKIRIRYVDKTQNDMTKPDNILAYKRDYADFMDKHKKLAAYAVYDKCLFDEDDLKEFKKLVLELKEGEERTGIICTVVNDVPIFVHSTLKEYFAIEYICDLIFCKKDKQTIIWEYIINEMFFNCNKNVLATLDDKLFNDNELSLSLKTHHKLIFDLLLKQGKNPKHRNGEIQSALCEAIRHDLRNLVNILFTSIVKVNLNESNLMDFIKIVNETNMLIVAVKMDNIEPLTTIVDAVNKIDKTKLRPLLANIKLDIQDIEKADINDLIQKIHEYVWTRMDIVPDWKKMGELSQQIYFI